MFEGKEYRVSDIDPIAESTMGYVLKPELFIGKGYEQIENMTESDLSTGATYTTTKVRDMIPRSRRTACGRRALPRGSPINT